MKLAVSAEALRGGSVLERLLVIGGNGSGKTTLSRELAERLGLPLTHLDRLYWRDHWQNAPDGEFDALLLRELEQPRWILDGNISRTLPLRLTYCDTVVFLDYSRGSCLWGAVRRFVQNYGKSRPDMGGYCPERLSREKLRFFYSIWRDAPKTSRRFHELLQHAPGVELVLLKNRRQAAEFLRSLPPAAPARTRREAPK